MNRTIDDDDGQPLCTDNVLLLTFRMNDTRGECNEMK